MLLGSCMIFFITLHCAQVTYLFIFDTIVQADHCQLSEEAIHWYIPGTSISPHHRLMLGLTRWALIQDSRTLNTHDIFNCGARIVPPLKYGRYWSPHVLRTTWHFQPQGSVCFELSYFQIEINWLYLCKGSAWYANQTLLLGRYISLVVWSESDRGVSLHVLRCSPIFFFTCFCDGCPFVLLW